MDKENLNEKESQNNSENKVKLNGVIKTVTGIFTKFIAVIFKFVERHLILAILIIGFFFFGFYKIASFSFLDGFFKQKGVTTMNVNMKGYKRIDTLFTSFAYVPIINFKEKTSLLDYAPNSIKEKSDFFNKNPDLASGYCLRRYEVGLGYKDIFEIYKANKDIICKQKDATALPFPTQVSVNSISSEIYGSYTQKECDLFDRVDENGSTMARRDIAAYINDKYGAKLFENSQKMLMVFLSGYCSMDN